MKKIKELATKCVGLKEDMKCRIHDVDTHNFLCKNKCCIFCEEYDDCPHSHPCTKIRVFEDGEVRIHDTEKASEEIS